VVSQKNFRIFLANIRWNDFYEIKTIDFYNYFFLKLFLFFIKNQKMQREFSLNIIILLAINLLIKPFFIFGFYKLSMILEFKILIVEKFLKIED